MFSGWNLPDRGVSSVLVVADEPLVKDGSQCWQGRGFRDPRDRPEAFVRPQRDSIQGLPFAPFSE